MKAKTRSSGSILMLIFSFFVPSHVQSQPAAEKIRVGIFDSRCVAMAYGRTDFLKEIGELRKEHEKAKADGNDARVKELEKYGPTLQFIMHQQGFSTGSVMNIIKKIKDQIPAIAERNRVRLIISKWELCHQDDSVETVDVTDQMVSLFHPDEQTLEIIEDVKKMEPVPIEQISGD